MNCILFSPAAIFAGRFRFFCLWVLFIFCSSAGAWAQSDSLTVIHSGWEQQSLAPGVRLKQCWYDHSLFGASENVTILDVKLSRKNRLHVAADSNRLQLTSAFSAEYNALAGINGTFFDMKNGGSVDYVREKGKAINQTRVASGMERALHQKAAIVIRGQRVGIVVWDGSADWEKHLKGEDIMVSGPLLLLHGAKAPLDSSAFVRMRHPRTAVALKGNHLFLITVDGRNERSAGMSLYELSNYLRWLGADEAINLDGGGSTTMWVSGHQASGVVNHPSDNPKMIKSADYKAGMDPDNLAADTHRWDHGAERPVANILYISRGKK